MSKEECILKLCRRSQKIKVICGSNDRKTYMDWLQVQSLKKCHGNMHGRYFAHDTIGTTGDADMGNNGPCVGCHMRTDEGHLFESVEKTAGQVTNITSFSKVCSKCHTDESTLTTKLNDLKVDFEAALDALKTQLGNNEFNYLGSYPYFSNSDWTSAGDPTGKKNMGAAFNYNLLLHEPGCYIHNIQYTKKLLYDSIDFLDNGSLDSSVEATLGGAGNAYDFLGGTRP